jgi:hypothetical protein
MPRPGLSLLEVLIPLGGREEGHHPSFRSGAPWGHSPRILRTSGQPRHSSQEDSLTANRFQKTFRRLPNRPLERVIEARVVLPLCTAGPLGILTGPVGTEGRHSGPEPATAQLYGVSCPFRRRTPRLGSLTISGSPYPPTAPPGIHLAPQLSGPTASRPTPSPPRAALTCGCIRSAGRRGPHSSPTRSAGDV